jgi:hypothetical protein
MQINQLFSRIIPLKYIITEKDYLSKVEEVVCRVNEIIRHTYQFIRMYFIFLRDNKMSFPVIDRSFLKGVFSLISTRRKSNTINETAINFFNDHYSKTMIDKENGVGLKQILDAEIITIITYRKSYKNYFLFLNF